MATEFGTGKTIFILAIVVGCFAILWPKIFYPMLQSSVSVKPNIVPSADCCDVIFEKDLNAIKIMTQLCESILSTQSDFDKRLRLSFQHGKLTKEIVNRCNAEVHNKCDVDIREFLMEKVRLGRTYQQMLSELRSLNSSFCLKMNFGVSPGLIGAPRRMRVWEAKTLRQERPPHLRPHMDMMHPALREKGRAIPHSHIVPRVMEKEAPSAPLPMPMRPPMGGAGHVVPAPKGGSTMGIIMPLYTIGIVIFFMYTMMKLLFKKSEESNAYKEFQPDPEFRRVVFSDTERTSQRQKTYKEPHVEDSTTKLVVSAISGLVAEVNRDILSKQEASGAHAEEEPVKPNAETKLDEEIKSKVEDKLEDKSEIEEKEVEKFQVGELEANSVDREAVFEEKIEGKPVGGAVQVVGMEMTESVEGGQKWSRPATPLTPRSVTPTPPPQSIYLEGSLPSQSQLLVSQSEIEKLSQESDESPVILAGKVTLSLIGVDDTLKSDNGGPMITSVSSDEASEEEEEDEIEVEEVEVLEQAESEDEAEPVDNVGTNGEEDLTTNYTTASAAGGLADETAADFSVMDTQHDEEKGDNEEELEEDIILSTAPVTVYESKEEKEEQLEEEEHEKDAISAPSKVQIQPAKLQDEDEEEEVEEEFEEDEEEEEEEEDVEIENEIKPSVAIKAPETKPVEVEEEVEKEQEVDNDEEEEEEEEEEEDEEEEEIGRPQSLQHQHQR